ncbi:MAG: class I SAM-dependent methyltransferase [Akkermansiaceae bacterium]|nr:class I SAM-dependent methyltransferase [Akkermansiaceae bacterium]
MIHGLDGVISKKLGNEYYLIRVKNPDALHGSQYIRWNLPVEHAWPCNPEKMEGFIEKAAQTIFRKFGHHSPQAIFIGQLDPSAANRYYKALASNLRGRTLQLFPQHVAAFKDVEAQDSKLPTLFCMVGKEGLFCGMQSPLKSNGFYPGGTKYIRQNAPDTISRAGAKIAEAMHYLLLHRQPVPKGAHWLELGASPGGMTSELLDRGYQVTAIDRAALDKRLDRVTNLNFALIDVAAFHPNANMSYDAILSDMNGDARDAIQQVCRLARNLKPGGLVVFTLKTPGVTTFSEMNDLYQFVIKTASDARLELFAKTHLTYNRHEFTLFFEAPILR